MIAPSDCTHFERFEPASVRLLTWAGLRGALAIALALALPTDSPARAPKTDEWTVYDPQIWGDRFESVQGLVCIGTQGQLQRRTNSGI
jgi:hypothetical protein